MFSVVLICMYTHYQGIAVKGQAQHTSPYASTSQAGDRRQSFRSSPKARHFSPKNVGSWRVGKPEVWAEGRLLESC